MADDTKTYTDEQVQAMVEEKLAAEKADKDKAFATLWEEAKAAKAKAKEFEAKEREYQAKLTKLEQAKKAEKAGVTSEELERLRNEVRADLEKEYGEFRTRAERLAQDNRALRLDDNVKGIMAKHGVRAERVDALYRLTGEHYDLTEDGKPMLKDRPGTPVEKFIQDELSKQYPEFFQGSGSNGGGASKSVAGGAGIVGRSIAAGDLSFKGFLENVEAIAERKVEVRPS